MAKGEYCPYCEQKIRAPDGTGNTRFNPENMDRSHSEIVYVVGKYGPQLTKKKIYALCTYTTIHQIHSHVCDLLGCGILKYERIKGQRAPVYSLA